MGIIQDIMPRQVHSERILVELYKVIKGKDAGATGRAQRAALVKFGKLCNYLDPGRCRKFALSLIPPIEVISTSPSGPQMVRVPVYLILLFLSY